MNIFLPIKDELSKLINEKANYLYEKLLTLPVDEIEMIDNIKSYYINRHIKRLYFSVQTASVLLYDSLKLNNKPYSEVVIMEYGGGMGSLYLLTQLIGCKTVIYEDISADMTSAAQKIAEYLNIPIDHYIVGDHNYTLKYLKEHNIECDIIISRNVIEHIYNLEDFYKQMAKFQPNAILYFSTTANIYNPAMRWYHRYVHKKFEKRYKPQRADIIKKHIPNLKNDEVNKLAAKTRGLAVEDLEKSILEFKNTGIYPNPNKFYSNTCDPSNGAWEENLIKESDYKRIIEQNNYALSYFGAFWDTHYTNSFKNLITKSLNSLSKLVGKKYAAYVTPFVYIVAIPRKKAGVL